jgi:hypothetical protein
MDSGPEAHMRSRLSLNVILIGFTPPARVTARSGERQNHVIAWLKGLPRDLHMSCRDPRKEARWGLDPDRLFKGTFASSLIA